MRRIDIDEVRRALDEAPPPTIPSNWTGAYVGDRLVEAFRVLDRLPDRSRPQGFRSFSLFLAGSGYEFTDERAIVHRIRPSAAEISRMERALAWPDRYLSADPRARQCLLVWAFTKVRNGPIKWLLVREDLTRTAFDDARRRGAYAIAVSLSRERIPID